MGKVEDDFCINVSEISQKTSLSKIVQGEREFPSLFLRKREVRFGGKIKFNLILENVDSGILVKGKVEGNLLLQCDRCLETFTYPSIFEVKEIFYWEEGKGEFFVKQESIDLKPLFEQSFLLSIPFSPLCKKDCRGICPICGKNLNDGSCKCKPSQAGSPLKKLGKLLEED